MEQLDDSGRLLAATYMEAQLDVLPGELAGVRLAEDAECVHRARVASRRLRAALRMFAGCFPRKAFKRWRKGVRDVTKRLGEARDKDVQILAVGEMLGGLKEAERGQYGDGLERVLLRLGQERDGLQPAVVRVVDAFASSGVLVEMRDAAAVMRGALIERRVDYDSARLGAFLTERVSARQQALCALEACLEAADRPREQHEMRIAAKRLRYTLEICDLARDGGLEAAVKSVKKLQTLLGDLHDCDVWLEFLADFGEAERLRTLKYFGDAGPFSLLAPGIAFLDEARRAQRQQLFLETAAHWNGLRDAGFWDGLDALMHGKCGVE